MNRMDLHNTLTGVIGLAPTTISTNTTTLGVEIDIKGFDALEYFIHTATVTDGAYVVSFVESDTTGGTFTAVPSANVRGNADIAIADDNVIKRIGYVGKKQFVKLSIVSTGVTTGAVLNSVLALKGSATSQPTAD